MCVEAQSLAPHIRLREVDTLIIQHVIKFRITIVLSNMNRQVMEVDIECLLRIPVSAVFTASDSHQFLVASVGPP